MSIIPTKDPSPELVEKAKEIVKAEYPDAFCDWGHTWAGTKIFQIQRVIKSRSNEDGDEREDLSPSAFSEADAWIYAADRLSR